MHNADLHYKTTCSLGEGPVWDTERNGLWWVDIKKKKVYFLSNDSDTPQTINLSQMVGTVVPTTDNRLLVALENTLEVVSPENGQAEIIYPIEPNLPQNRSNDGKCDAKGRLWLGTMSVNEEKFKGNLYSYDPQNGLRLQREQCSISNGLCWNADNTVMYYIDTPDHNIKAFDFDLENGTISNERVVVEIENPDWMPDGMTIDSAGNLWVAMWGGASVQCFDPITGKTLDSVSVPALQTTCCTFGGENMSTLYITSARTGMNEQQLQEYPLSGSVFKVELPVTGQAPYRMEL
jgi:sugar lactone lactonase YvrE